MQKTACTTLCPGTHPAWGTAATSAIPMLRSPLHPSQSLSTRVSRPPIPPCVSVSAGPWQGMGVAAGC